MSIRGEQQTGLREGLELRTYLRLDQHKVDKQHHQIMLDIFIGKSLASWALRQAYTLSERLVIGLAVGCVQVLHWEATSTFN